MNFLDSIKQYISEVNRLWQTGQAREHSYRPALQQFLESILPGKTVINEPARSECGAPDLIITGKDVLPVAFIEAKDIGDTDLDGHRQHREQFGRYRASLEHLVFTDYLDFHLYEKGEWVENVRIGEILNGTIRLIGENSERFRILIQRLADAVPQPITSASRLAQLMAGKARLLSEVIKSAFREENESYGNKQLQGQLEAFKRVLIHDLTPESFADIYAQTIAYGMFAARLHDPSPETFSRQEASILIPKTNPFLRQIFQSIAGYDLDDRIAWIVDDLAVAFRATDIAGIMRDYGRNRRHSDPMIHFYEDFLSAYDPHLRKAKGVWYTPQPIVRFIIKAVDSLLKSEFGLSEGLADCSKIEKEVINDQYSKGKKGGSRTYKQAFHRVQILDPATGTGTFLAEVVNHIHDKLTGMQGVWQSYVEEHLLPRLNGFELLMASYAVAHLKLDMLLQSTGYIHRSNSRLHIYLTNSLEEYSPDTGSIFAQWLSNEAEEANHIKRDTPVMVILGNPPYSGESRNKGTWIMRLMEDYKKEPGGKIALNERNPKWLNDDYVKFIRMAQYFIDKNGEGIIAFINPHGYLDNPTFRGMRWALLNTFDKIYTIDLHGNSKKGGKCPDGSPDENVFDIMQGVSINFFVKSGRTAEKAPCRVFHYDLFGKRTEKYRFLETSELTGIPFKELHPQEPMYFFVPKDYSLQREYNMGLSINDIFKVNSVGIVTTKDQFLICYDKNTVEHRIYDLINLSEDELKKLYGLYDTRDWSINRAKADVGETVDRNCIVPLNYRPFDTRYIYYTGKTNGIVAWPRFHSMRHLQIPSNFALITCRQSCGEDWALVSITQSPFNQNGFLSDKGERGYVDDCRISNKTKERGYMFPLYITGEAGRAENAKGQTGPVPNFNPDILAKIESSLGETIVPLELFDYIYAVLHSPSYRERYREFLKTDFPRIPYPSDKAMYHRLAELGSRLRRLHLMEDADNWQTDVTFPVPGDSIVDTPFWMDRKVFINTDQYFGNIPEESWNFHIGGYRPAEKWLKDRKGRELSYGDIRHYCRIIHALKETAAFMQDVDRILLLHN